MEIKWKLNYRECKIIQLSEQNDSRLSTDLKMKSQRLSVLMKYSLDALVKLPVENSGPHWMQGNETQ